MITNSGGLFEPGSLTAPDFTFSGLAGNFAIANGSLAFTVTPSPSPARSACSSWQERLPSAADSPPDGCGRELAGGRFETRSGDSSSRRFCGHHDAVKFPPLLPAVLLLTLLLPLSGRAEEAVLSVDFSVPTGSVRALNGVNKGPLAPGGMFDVIEQQRELKIPFTRLHDCGWPNPYVVDHHAVFPNPDADPALPESYDFRLTDEYIAAVRATGAEPIYRLGESIEHTSVRRFVHPPADPEKWAAICLGIIRHYNEGWANGFRYNIKYWEIWNEPENRPAMWSGTDDDYLRLYRTAAKAIKTAFPAVKVGGPALGASGSFVNGEFQPTEFTSAFLTMCRKDNVPVNFFSWHCYTDDPQELVARGRAIRRLLDSRGFDDTENHLNEWNFLPNNSWKPISRGAPAEARTQAYAEMAGAHGAAFIVSALLELQDVPMDVCNFYHGEIGGFGLFSDQGVPQKSWQALRAFRGLLDTPARVEAAGSVPGKLDVVAGLSPDGREASILVSNFADPRPEVLVKWSGFAWTGVVTAEIRVIGESSDFQTARVQTIPADETSLRLKLPAPGVASIHLKPSAGATALPTLAITSPANRLVFQRDASGHATLRIAGKSAWPGAAVEARLVDVASGKAGEWSAAGTVQPDLTFHGKLDAPAGWYALEARVRSDGKNLATARVQRVGIGEVFVVVGHSVAHGGLINLPGATDDRVNTIALPTGDPQKQRSYKSNGDPALLPPVVGRHFDSLLQPAPAGNGTYFWAAFAENLAKAQDVPVLLLNAAFGGTSLEHWAKSARGEMFDHPFIRATARMPYIRLQHALQKYCAVTGLRAILADQGQNDWPERDEEKLFANYEAWIAQARKDAAFPDLAIVINRQSPPDAVGQIRRTQERVIRDTPHCYPGADYDTLGKDDTVDKIHLSAPGQRKAAQMWATALDAHFFKTAAPLLPTGTGDTAPR